MENYSDYLRVAHSNTCSYKGNALFSIATWCIFCIKRTFLHRANVFLFFSEFFMPGMVDTHIHASQYSYAGTALDMPLLQWLNTYTFPIESRFKDLEFANKVYTQVVVSFKAYLNIFVRTCFVNKRQQVNNELCGSCTTYFMCPKTSIVFMTWHTTQGILRIDDSMSLKNTVISVIFTPNMHHSWLMRFKLVLDLRIPNMALS